MPISEMADRYTVLRIKFEHGLDTYKQMMEYSKSLQAIDTNELYEVNLKMWRLEEMISDEKDIEKIGAYYLALRWMSHKRLEAKNKIAEICNEYKELKKY